MEYVQLYWLKVIKDMMIKWMFISKTISMLETNFI